MGPRTFPTRNDLPVDNRRDLAALLNQHLADTLDLYTQTKYAHWNVKGPNFISLHKLFDELADMLEEATDTIAERATALGMVAKGTARQAAAGSRLPEFPAETFGGQSVVEALAIRFADLAKTTREAIDKADELADKDTADVFTEVSRELDKGLWFLEAHLQG
ncbi:MAG TPA: DNA starvation/stationary phase protection protein Dps [Gemmataceae bacterium]|nr:DNA starvation/stationary phase protection protein Dps [Gemmataceae bacterium]